MYVCIHMEVRVHPSCLLFLFLRFIYIYFMFINVCINAFMCPVCIQDTRRPEEGVGSLKLELQIVVSIHVGIGNQT